ncbi:MAG TPA: efflux RND transporter permease subunit [Thermoanaerobaculia bacterium]|nr:efflux RND transporter permease subunit [Thermoanaerobaculia bacterium]
MKLVHEAIRLPVTTAVGAILLALFGVIGLYRLPVQLSPTIEEPEVGVTTIWPGASPHEIEREIVDKQEEQLKGLEGLVRMDSSSADSVGSLTLVFQTGTDVDAALLKVSNRLEQVPSYPADVDKPVIRSVGADASPIAWFILLPRREDGYRGDIWTLRTFIEEDVKPEIERVPGVGAFNVFGGREEEMQVVVDPAALAARQITLPELMAALDRENRNISGGDFFEGKRRYVVRAIGEYTSPEQIEQVVVAVRNGVPIRVGDVGRAQLGHARPGAMGYFMGEPSIAFNVVRSAGANVLAVMAGVQRAMLEVEEDLLAPRGLTFVQVYDETDYIRGAIDLVQQSLMLGGVLAILMLLVFLRSRTSTLVIAVAIPISVVGTFLMMWWFGRTLNVISLAGLAFAVGMVVDNSIVVLENIYRHRQLGKSRRQAAYDGTTEVWGAVLASTLTTIAVFLPVLFVQEEAGQLFRDIAIAISCAVGLSLIVAMTIIPSLSAKILGAAAPAGEDEEDDELGGEYGSHRPGSFKNLWGFVPQAQRFNEWVASTVYRICGSTPRRLAVVLGFTVAALGLSWLLMPKAEYLPTGNLNFVFGMILPSPGQSMDENAELQHLYVEKLRPLWEASGEEADGLPGGGVMGYFFVALNDRVFMGARSRDEQRARELLPVFWEVNSQIPGAIAFATQPGLFQRGLGEGRTIDVEVTGPDLPRLVDLGGEIFGRLPGVLPGAQAIPIPSLDLGNPEVQVRTDRRRAAEVGLSHRDLGMAVDALVDGAKASEYRHQGKEIDLRVIAEQGELSRRTHLIEQLPLAAPSGELVTVGSVAEVVVDSGPAQIAHRERQRAITIQVTPAEEMPLQEAMERIASDILAPMREEGRLGGLYRARMAGTADKLTQTGRALMWNFLLAVVITYLLMAALFESFLYPLVILFSVPLAALGGFLGLGVVNLFTHQALDVLTMLGFIILVGTVVNNAILIVHQTLNHMREEEMPSREAIREATANRIRPIFMSVGTSVCGMLPLVLFPGPGSELYRGLGSVVIGGLLVSTLFTLFLVPALLSLVLEARERLAARWRGLREAESAEAPV